MVTWLAKKLAKIATLTASDYLIESYNNVQAYKELKRLLEEAAEKNRSECRSGGPTRLCPEHSALTGMYDRRAGGTSTLHIYTLVGYDGTKILLQFYETSKKIRFWHYSKDYKPLDSGQALDPVEALAHIKKATGIGVTPVSM